MSGISIHDAECVGERDKAILVEAPDFDEPQWIPKSVIHDDSEVYRADTDGVLVVKNWFAEKKGWD